MFIAITAIVTFATLAMLVQHGVWHNLISLIAIALGGTIAFGVHQPIVVWIDGQTEGSFTYLLDFPVLWITFALVNGVIKQLANMLSAHKVAFPERIDGLVGSVIGLLAGYLMACFTMASFYAAPLSRDLMNGAYDHGETVVAVQKALDDSVAVTKPDFAWLTLMGNLLDPEVLGGGDGFSPAIFAQQHTKHRGNFETLDVSVVRRK